MPTYEYRCVECHKRFEIFLTYANYDRKKVTCPACGSHKIQRRIGRIRIAKAEESRLEDLVDPANLNGIEDDPKALGRLMRRMGDELGEEVGPEFDEVVSRLEKGQGPEQIEQELSDSGGDSNESWDGGD